MHLKKKKRLNSLKIIETCWKTKLRTSPASLGAAVAASFFTAGYLETVIWLWQWQKYIKIPRMRSKMIRNTSKIHQKYIKISKPLTLRTSSRKFVHQQSRQLVGNNPSHVDKRHRESDIPTIYVHPFKNGNAISELRINCVIMSIYVQAHATAESNTSMSRNGQNNQTKCRNE